MSLGLDLRMIGDLGGGWYARALELGLSEPQAILVYKADAGKVLTKLAGRWRWGGGWAFALTSTVSALARRKLLERAGSGYRLTRLGLQAAMYVRGEGVERPEVPR